MSDIEKSRNPFEKFINKLEALNGLPDARDGPGELEYIEKANEYARLLATKYGLPQSDDIQAFVAELVELAITTEIVIEPIRMAYINMILWDAMMANEKKPFQAMKVALIYGFCLHVIMQLDSEADTDV